MIKQFTKLLCGLVLLIASGAIKAQTNIAAYRLTKTTGTAYTPLTGDVAIFTGTWDSEVSGALPLGGTFTYGGTPYTTCYVSANGHLDFGASSSSTAPLSSTSTTLLGAIAAFAQDGASSTVTGSTPKVSYATVGSEFVVQFQDHANYFNRAQERLNFQIRLNLSTNEIKIVYGTCTNPGTTSTSGTSVQVGLRGNNSTWTTNVNNLTIGNVPTGATCNWADAVTGNANSSTLLFSGTTNVNVNIPPGLTFTWLPASTPLPVRTFYAVTNITTSSATITWAPATGATQYNVQYRIPGTCAWTNFGSAPVSDTTATITGLVAGTSYQVRVQSVSAAGNSIWSHIPTSATGTGLNGYTATGTFSTVASCSVPTAVTISSITTTSATISFTSTGNNFVVEYGANGFTPGTGATAGTGGTIVSGTSSPIVLNGLSSGTAYSVYVRQNCTASGNAFSANSSVASFSTNCVAGTVPYTENFDGVTAPALPPCITVEDVNGANTWATYATTFTGSSSPNVMRYLYSTTTAADDWFFVKGLNLTAGTAYQLSFKYGGTTSFPEKLEVRVGTSPNSTSALAGTQIFNNSNIIVTSGDGTGTFTPTTTGVYYFGFHVYSIADQNFLYIDNINIDVAPACPVPSAVTVGSITSNSASVSFTSTGRNFILEYGATGFTPGTGATAGTGGTIVTGTASPIALTGLTPGTTYQVYVRQNCTAAGNGYSTNSAVTSFTTNALPPANDNICGAVTISTSLNATCSTILTGQSTAGATQSLAGCVGTADEDVWYKFVATDTMHTITLTNSGNGSTDRVHQIFSSSDNTCTGTLTSIKCSDPEISTTGGLIIGNTYFVRVYSYTSTVTSFATFDICITSPAIPSPPPVNDNASGAITLTAGAGCTGAAYSNVGATLNTGEPYPSCSGIANAPVWFKFVAPASGAVRVSTDVGTGGTFTDPKVAIFSATNASDYTTFSIISCDDDGGSINEDAAVVYATGLIAGTTYYVAVDRYNPGTTTGSFCIAVDELSSAMLATANTCTSSYQTSTSNSSSNYTGWVPLVDGSSRLVALVRNSAGGSVSSYTFAQNVNTSAVRQSNNTYYLNRNYRITNTAATNVNVQLFFLNTELTSLATADPSVTLANLGVTRQAEAPVGCYSNFSPANGAITFIPQTGNGSTGGVSWINFTTPGFSNFYLNRAGTALPITLEYLKGLKAGTGNALNWKVNCTSVSIIMELERSSDSRTFKSITSITATQARCGQPFDYTDVAPLKGTNYYRLKMIDVDGKVTYSPIVAIINGGSGAELVGIYPTVVRDEAFLSVAASRTAKMQINISDMSGKVIRTISQTVANGSSLLSINTANLATGIYNITGLLDGVQTKTLRFVKQ